MTIFLQPVLLFTFAASNAPHWALLITHPRRREAAFLSVSWLYAAAALLYGERSNSQRQLGDALPLYRNAHVTDAGRFLRPPPPFGSWSPWVV